MTDNENPVPHSHQDPIRASDADRDTVANQLREALAEGRITPAEHSERLESVYGATTRGELAPLTEDLPAIPDNPSREVSTAGVSAAPRPVYGRERVGGKPTGGFSVAIMGGSNRTGNWIVPRHYFCVAVMGGVELDLREARFSAPEVTIHANTLMGGIEITAPDDIEVRIHGIGVMGGYGTEGEPPSVLESGTPVVHVVGVALMAGVDVHYKKRQHQKRSRRTGDAEIEDGRN
ncbi:uncharacterized protein DUF1707 [Haloactinospora alba]|uniref:Uncharacterized protein DUF1707 n=1 Tax=Haloactinospora alba TaxID=405555 RepID=A0A543NLB0_9ACTN|nr:DUF1707 domain-containing protein [Haloactinospora alba]TQN32599.1 uncharacterized protein DUF1707 [Haloactinospora alba]